MVDAPRAVEVEAVLRAMTSGRNRALLMVARDAAGARVDCVVKVPALSENPGLHPVPSLFEWLAAAIARALQVPVPEPLKVQWSAALAAATVDPTWRRGLEQSAGPVFGSAFIAGLPQVRAELLDASLRSAALRLLLFDVFVQNIDRRAENPNLFLRREEFVAIDHGEAFSFVWPSLLPSDPVTDPVRGLVQAHALLPLLRRRGGPRLGELAGALGCLDDQWWSNLVASTPGEWREGPASGKIEIVIETLMGRRDAVATWLPQVEALIEARS